MLPGEVLALLGPNGAGKTTAVEICAGFREASTGSAQVLGLTPRDRRLRSRVGYMPQEDGMQSSIRAREAIELFASFHEHPMDPAALLERLELTAVADRYWRRLSGGERRRLSLGMAIVGRPELVFLDEPTAGMDVRARARTWELVRELTGGGCAVLLTTHLIEEAERTADRVTILDRGRVAASGTPAEVIGSVSRISVRTDRPLPAEELSAGLGVPVTAADGWVHVEAEPTPRAIADLTAWLAARGVLALEIRAGRGTLDEAFLALTDQDRT